MIDMKEQYKSEIVSKLLWPDRCRHDGGYFQWTQTAVNSSMGYSIWTCRKCGKKDIKVDSCTPTVSELEAADYPDLTDDKHLGIMLDALYGLDVGVLDALTLTYFGVICTELRTIPIEYCNAKNLHNALYEFAKGRE